MIDADKAEAKAAGSAGTEGEDAWASAASATSWGSTVEQQAQTAGSAGNWGDIIEKAANQSSAWNPTLPAAPSWGGAAQIPSDRPVTLASDRITPWVSRVYEWPAKYYGSSAHSPGAR